jgi:type II secretory pathway component GspD/PulD (secretin)
MDGNRASTSRFDRARAGTLLALVAVMMSIAPGVQAEAPKVSKRRDALQRFSGRNVALHPLSPLRARPATTVRPRARIVDARQSPIVAVVSGVESEAEVNAEFSEVLNSPAAGIPESPSVQNTNAASETTAAPINRQLTVEEALEIRGSVTFRKTPISEVVFLLSDLWKINIVAGADVSGDVSGAFQNAPLREVLSAALTASGYGYRQIGSSLVVLPLDQIGSPGSAPTGATGFSQSGIAYFTPQFTEAEQMAEPLQLALGESVVVAVYPEENRIMVKGTPDDLRLASEAIAQLDVPRPQVRITAMIYDVGLGELEKLGFNWNREVRELANGTDEALAEVTQTVNEFFAASSDLTSTGITNLGLRTITSSINANVFLEALDSNSEAKLLADPSITVGDRTEASIRIVQQIPIVGANPVEGSNAVFTQTEFKEAGVILVVTPRISRDGTIELAVQPEYSVVSEITPSGPVIDTRTANTIVRVNDGQMFVLGGLRQKSIVETVRGIPYLREISVVGKLFRAHSTEVRESELIVFLKPELITPYYTGHPREQIAGCVASDQLDRIPHAQPQSIIPDCRDCYCPNHYPRPRANGGSYSLEMVGGSGFGPYEMIAPRGFEITDPEIDVNLTPDPHPAVNAVPKTGAEIQSYAPALEPTVVEELHPPVHIDRRALNPN